jgi:hypothetical protein
MTIEKAQRAGLGAHRSNRRGRGFDTVLPGRYGLAASLEMERVELRWVDKLIMHRRAQERDRLFKSIGVPSAPDSIRRRRAEMWQEETGEVHQEFDHPEEDDD